MSNLSTLYIFSLLKKNLLMDKLAEETKSAKRLVLNIGKLLIAHGLRRETNECPAKEGS